MKSIKNIYKYSNCLEHLFILGLSVTVCVSSSMFASIVCVPVGIASSAAGLKMCAITAEIKKYKSIINKKNRKHDEIVLLGKIKLDAIEVLSSKALIDSYISHDELLSVNNVLREFNEMKEGIKFLKPLCKML